MDRFLNLNSNSAQLLFPSITFLAFNSRIKSQEVESGNR